MRTFRECCYHNFWWCLGHTNINIFEKIEELKSPISNELAWLNYYGFLTVHSCLPCEYESLQNLTILDAQKKEELEYFPRIKIIYKQKMMIQGFMRKETANFIYIRNIDNNNVAIRLHDGNNIISSNMHSFDSHLLLAYKDGIIVEDEYYIYEKFLGQEEFISVPDLKIKKVRNVNFEEYPLSIVDSCNLVGISFISRGDYGNNLLNFIKEELLEYDRDYYFRLFFGFCTCKQQNI